MCSLLLNNPISECTREKERRKKIFKLIFPSIIYCARCRPDDGGGNSDDEDGIDLVASTQVTNINANLDVALIDLWPLIANSGRDHTPLPDIEEGITVVFSSKRILIQNCVFNQKLFKKIKLVAV